MARRWSYMLLDLLTEQVVARHVPFTGVKFTDSINGGASTFSGSFPVGHPAWSPYSVTNDLCRRVIVPMRYGRPMGFFLFTAMPSTPAAATMQPVTAQRLDWLLSRRPISSSLSFVDVDQNDIFRDLVRFGLGRSTRFTAGGPQQYPAELAPSARVPWIRLDDAKSGVLRTRQETDGNGQDGYPASARKVVADMLKNLTGLRDDRSAARGPEYRWLYGVDQGVPYMQLQLSDGSFKVGVPESADGKVTLSHPGNVASASYGADGTSIVTVAHMLGQETGGSRPIGEAHYWDLLGQGYPYLGAVQSVQVQDHALLEEKAAGVIWAADDDWSITLDSRRRPGLPELGLGDYVTFQVRRGDVRRDRSMRVTGWSVSVDDSGESESVTPTVQAGRWLS